MKKEYLGDGVYIEPDKWDPYSLRLTTEDGIETTNEIILDSGVAGALREYLRRWNDE